MTTAPETAASAAGTHGRDVMTAVAEARVLPEPLTLSYERLQAAWPA